jgi:hypothetical protein
VAGDNVAETDNKTDQANLYTEMTLIDVVLMSELAVENIMWCLRIYQ